MSWRSKSYESCCLWRWFSWISSQGTNIVFLTGNGRSAPVTCQSKKLDRETKSPLASEVMLVATDSDFMVASIAKELYGRETLPVIELLTKSKSLKEHLGTTKVVQDRLRVDSARMREMVEIGEVHVTWAPTELMLTDCLFLYASSDLLRKSWQVESCLKTCENNNKIKM